MKESILFYIVKVFGIIIRALPLSVALWVGRMIGLIGYYFDAKHKAIAYGNLKMAFADTKPPREIKKITKELFQNYGQNIIELFRMPLINPEKINKVVSAEGREHVADALKEGKGAILLAMHFGSWELTSLTSLIIDAPYKHFVKPQDKYSRLNDLLNSYRECGGSVVLSRGSGTKDFVNSLKNNEVVGIVVDQGGKDGKLVPFFGRQASMSVGAIRMGLKRGVPICFSVIVREGTGRHRMVIHKALTLQSTGDAEKDIEENLSQITRLMEQYIRKYPSEYFWFYKIWKYSKESKVLILHDGRVGHLRQSETVARLTQKLLNERGIEAGVQTAQVTFRSKFLRKAYNILSTVAHPLLFLGRLDVLKWVLTKESFKDVMSTKADFVISCGSSVASVNYLLALDHNAKSIVVQKPGGMNFKKFDLVILPQHDLPNEGKKIPGVAVTKGAPNLIDQQYLEDQTKKLLQRFSHLKSRTRFKIGLLVGGDAKNLYLSDQQMRILINQLKEVARTISADLLVTTSRRTPGRIEQMLAREFKDDQNCPLLILANQSNVPQAVGGILGLSDIVVVSGDSISMVSEAASSGKYTVVFSPQKKEVVLHGSSKHHDFIEKLNAQGFILSSNVKDIGQSIYGIAKNKIQTRKIDDNRIIEEALRYII